MCSRGDPGSIVAAGRCPNRHWRDIRLAAAMKDDPELLATGGRGNAREGPVAVSFHRKPGVTSSLLSVADD